MRTGYAHLPLHHGSAPRWLWQRMVRLSREIVIHMVSEFGPAEVLLRLSDPYWFQALGCVLGFDWHSSGLTTTSCAAVKESIRGLEEGLGLWAAGGKGATSRKTPQEIETAAPLLTGDFQPLVYASRMSAKVDSAAVQDGYQLYHHSFFFTRSGDWCVIQQGINDANRMARRYHWRGDRLSSFVIEPHTAICCDQRAPSLDLTARENLPVQSGAAEMARRPAEENLSLLTRLPELELPRRHEVMRGDVHPDRLKKILLQTYEQAPQDFESLLGMPGVGAKTVRALALVAELVYGTPASTRDPARFSFAHGGKDGTPFPVDRATYESTIQFLHEAVNRARVDRSEKVAAFKRLAAFASS